MDPCLTAVDRPYDRLAALPRERRERVRAAIDQDLPERAPAFFFGQLIAYVTFDTLADLGFDDSFDELRIRVDDPDALLAEWRAVGLSSDPGAVNLGVTTIAANGDAAGRIEVRSNGN